ncbi:MAG TPA: cysteine hydrolase family protein [Acidimicrobiales bacterium]|jgi:nicotinamidase-related amidase|nr:cysteine hydrolase family protein [Acidimicrobiales bacterium]
MPIDLRELVAPERCAVLTMEIQRGVVGDLTSFPQLAEASRHVGVVPNTARLLAAARSHGVRVVHCTAEFRGDRAGSTVNCQLIAAVVRNPSHLLAGTPATEIIHELGPEPGDLVSPRLHGVSPFTGTSLDTWLRSLRVDTVVATGVSVNLGVLGLAIEAVNLGYQVVVPRDAVAGLPRPYADAVLDNTFPLITTLTTVDDLIEAWGPATA